MNYFSETLNAPVTRKYVFETYGRNPDYATDIGIFPIKPSEGKYKFEDGVDEEGSPLKVIVEEYKVIGYRKLNNVYYEVYVPFSNEQIENLKTVLNRVSAIESNEILDDATDTALLTLISNLTQRITDLEATVNG